MTDEPEWEESVSSLLGRSAVPAAQATGRLLDSARGRWEGRVVPRTSMHDLLFTVPGYPYPFEDSVRVAWSDDVFTFTLIVSSALQSADRARAGSAPAVLDSFLLQLVGGEADDPAPVGTARDRVISAVTDAWKDGCPVASDPETTATAALRRVSTLNRRYRGNGVPSREDRIEDLAKGLRDRFEEDRKLVGPLMQDYRYLASKILDVLYPEATQ